MYFQMLFAMDRIMTLAPKHLESKEEEPIGDRLIAEHPAVALALPTSWLESANSRINERKCK